MKEIVIVLGAGASHPYGAPLMKDFYNVAASLMVDHTATDRLQQEFSIVFDFIDQLQKAQAKANIDLHNIESVYTALEMAQLLGLDNLKSKQCRNWRKMDQAMKYFLSKSIESRCCLLENIRLPSHKQSEPGSISIKLPYQIPEDQAPLRAVVQQTKRLAGEGWNVSFITFNYDIVLESILGNLEMATDYNLPSETPISDDHSNKYMKVLKLHGSINWELASQCKGGTPLLRSHPIYPMNERIDINNPYYQVSSRNKVTSQFSDKLSYPVIVPPVWNKSNYHKPINSIWREAARRLSKASHIYCLGYSLPQTDGFFKQLFALGTVGVSPLQQFSVFDVEERDMPGGVHSRYLSMLGRGSENVFQYSPAGAGGLRDTLKTLK